MSGLDIGIVIGYFVVLLVIGFIGTKRAKTSDDYMVAGRRLGFWMFFACLCALLLGGASTIGTATLGYKFGISGLWLVTMLGLGIVLVGIVLIRRIYKIKVLTISELLADRYNKKAGILSALVSAVYTMMVCATQIIAMGTIVQVLAGWNPTLSMLAVGGIVIFYTILGGMWSITVTDLIQFGLIVIGILFVMLPKSLIAAGGLPGLRAALPPVYFSITNIGWTTIIQYFFLFCLGDMVGQDLWQRFFTGKSVGVARAGGIGVGIFALLYAIAGSLIGMSAKVVMPNIENTQLVFGTFAKEILPPGFLGLVLASVLAVLMSTASGTLLASSSLLSNDIFSPMFSKPLTDRGFLKLNRLVALAVGILALLVAVALNNILAALDVSYAILSGALFLPIILGIFWKRATANAAMISIACSSVVVIAGMIVHGISSVLPIGYGLLVSGLTMVLVTLLETRNKA